MYMEPHPGNALLFFQYCSDFFMAAIRVSSSRFGRRYEEYAKELIEFASGLPERPTPKDIHDVRVTARRIQVMRRLLPRAVRTSQASRHFDLVLKSLLKRTSQLRDLDTLVETLEQHKANIPADLLVKLENQRSDAAASARAAVDVLSESSPPDLEQAEVKGKRLSRRLRRMARKRGKAAIDLVPVVLEDESKVVELHSLRKEVKKLRYLLELSEKDPPELAALTRWQESLGAIHDLDVAMSFLEGVDFESKGRAISGLRKIRHRNYLKFIGEYRVDSMETLGRGRVLAGGPVPRSV